jgi:hypothetical protein
MTTRPYTIGDTDTDKLPLAANAEIAPQERTAEGHVADRHAERMRRLLEREGLRSGFGARVRATGRAGRTGR